MSELHLQNEKGQHLFARYWNKDGATSQGVKGLVFICHGYCEHVEYYKEIAEFLISHGFYVFSHDHIGHGQSEGDRAHILSFDDYVQDVFYHIDQVKKKFADKPVFIIGHSMGGAIAILSAMTRPKYFKGVVLIGPLIIPDRKAASPWKITMGRVLAKVLPQMHIAKIDPSFVSRDAQFVKQYEADSLVYHNGLKCRWGVAMLDALQKIEAGLGEIEWPFFTLHGDQDHLCEVDGSKELFEKAKSTDKKIKIFEGAYHQLHHDVDPVKKETFDLVTEWLEARA